MNSEVHQNMLSTQVPTNVSQLIGRCFILQQDKLSQTYC
uniref:Uncharacterized protein n=1 Tax=Anguilla anguilla TaxID=7936 RepID=A0A0E9PEX6_ANGAN